MVEDGKFEKLAREINNLRIGFLQLLLLKKLKKEEAEKKINLLIQSMIKRLLVMIKLVLFKMRLGLNNWNIAVFSN